jgi:RNA polymerase sigma factor (sigma-70 family)
MERNAVVPDSGMRRSAELRFSAVFAHLALLVAYARRRGAADPEAIAAEVMAIAWRRLCDVPVDDPRPWLIATARNVLLAERRKRGRADTRLDGVDVAAEDVVPLIDLDPELDGALRRLSASEREALLLVAWEDLSPTAAAASLGISPTAFRVRLHRARRRLAADLAARTCLAPSHLAHSTEES